MGSIAQVSDVHVELLGRFRVLVGKREVTAEAWPARRAAELVQLLALADGHRLARDQAIEALWPHLDADAGAANLRKAAHHARKALADPDAVILRGGQVALFPSRTVETDVERFEVDAGSALDGGDVGVCAAVATTYADLLPEARYEDWAHTHRERLRSTCAELLRRSEKWERLVELEPTDELAYRALMRRELAAGRRAAAIRWFGRLRNTLRRELRISPSAEAQAIYDECVAGLGVSDPPFVGRQLELAKATMALRSAAAAAACSTRSATWRPTPIGRSPVIRSSALFAACCWPPVEARPSRSSSTTLTWRTRRRSTWSVTSAPPAGRSSRCSPTVPSSRPRASSAAWRGSR